ncbi:MAG: YicC/YloC family endoribonuclease, partial [Syntrophales bacterium]|nr:YicC/YloC family endoribonuclease [Syntrophales bacterium]
MLKSMTGYGRAELLIEDKRLAVEMKSFNHRYLDVSLRLPALLLPFEIEIRKKIGGCLSRGRIEASIRVDSESGSESGPRFELNIPLFQNYYALLVRLKESFNLKGDVTLEMLAGFRDAFVPPETGKNLLGMWERIEKVLAEAITDLIKMRENEGEIICRDLISRIDTIRKCLDAIVLRAPQVVMEYQKRLANRVK